MTPAYFLLQLLEFFLFFSDIFFQRGKIGSFRSKDFQFSSKSSLLLLQPLHFRNALPGFLFFALQSLYTLCQRFQL